MSALDSASVTWGGYYDVLAKDCKEENITTFDPIFQVILDLEKTTNFNDMYQVLKNVSSETQNKLNSPLLDGLILFNEKHWGISTFGNNIELVKFLFARDTEKILGLHFDIAIKSSVKVVEFFLENFPVFKKITTDLVFDYISEMQFETVKYFIESGVPLVRGVYNFIIIQACYSTDIELVKYILEKTKKYCRDHNLKGNPLHINQNIALNNAIYTGKLEIIKYLLDEGAYSETPHYVARVIQENTIENHLQIVDLFVNDKTTLGKLKRLLNIAVDEEWFFAVEFIAKRIVSGKYVKTSWC